MHFNPAVQNDSMFNLDNLNSPKSQETALASWLTVVAFHSRDGSFESRKAVLALTEELPNCQSLPQDVQDAVNKINVLAQSKNWDPSLSPKSSKLLQKICRDYTQSKMPKPSCTKKLDFNL